jgi:hypothetical protein
MRAILVVEVNFKSSVKETSGAGVRTIVDAHD